MKKLVAFILISFSFLASADGTRDGTWLGFMQKKSISTENSIWTEVQFRYDLDQGEMGQTLIRFGGLSKINDQNEAGLLMCFVQTKLVQEYRPTLQHTLTLKSVSESIWSLRTRGEFRTLADSDDDALRARFLMRFQKPLSGNYALVVWDEPFFNLTREEWTGNKSFDRNRSFIGTRFTDTNYSVEIGYLNQFISRDKNITEHILASYLIF